eukprot:Seg440.6 transcript_id=Seg440.6/GoldUCD/mRNA.D3Y31 product=Epsin-2 protein_id=Seg440.6/GoldUCD/D3Y31
MALRRTVKNVVRNFTDIEVKVREATSNDPWGPSSSLMGEIADATYNVTAFSSIMSMLWKRLNDHGKNWRHVYKSLTVLDYIIKTGSDRVAQQCRENLFAIQTLKDFQFIDKDGKDQGINVREKSKQIVALLKDDERLKNERQRALKAKERFAQSQGGAGDEKRLEFVLKKTSSQKKSNPNSTLLDLTAPSAGQTVQSSSQFDPWASPGASAPPSNQPSFTAPAADPWAAPQAITTTQPFAAPFQPAPPPASDPWSSTAQPVQAAPQPDPWSSGPTQPAADPWVPVAAPAPNPSSAFNDPFGSQPAVGLSVSNGFDPRGSTSTVPSSESMNNPFDLTGMGDNLPSSGQQEPNFLGTNAKLVNLVDIVGTTSSESPTYNPFAATITPKPTNPFAADKPKAKSINELRSEQTSFVSVPNRGQPDVLLPTPLVPDSGSAPVTNNANPFLL